MKALSIKIAAALLSMVFTASNALADTWCHGFLKATDGTEIQIDYQIAMYSPSRMPTYWAMKNIYVHAKNWNFHGTEKVSMVFMTPWNGRPPEGGSLVRDVSFDGERFTAAGSDTEYGSYTSIVRPFTRWGEYGGEPAYHFEVAIVVDGRWLKDPVSGESNFKFSADKFPNLCANPY